MIKVRAIELLGRHGVVRVAADGTPGCFFVYNSGQTTGATNYNVRKDPRDLDRMIQVVSEQIETPSTDENFDAVETAIEPLLMSWM